MTPTKQIDWVRKDNSRPWVELWLELETRCNLACPFCYNFWKQGSVPEPNRASTNRTLGALRRLLDAVECRKLAVSGGEPLLRNDLFEILDLIRGYKIQTVLTSNGTLLSPERLQRLTDVGVSNFQIPLHSDCAETHDLLSGVPCWEKSLRAILLIQQSGASVVPVFVATGLNISHFPRVLNIFSALGIKKIIFNRFVPSGAGALNHQILGVPDESALTSILSQTLDKSEEESIEIELGVPVAIPYHMLQRWKNLKAASCPVELGQRRWTVGSDLSLRRCNHSQASIGNLCEDAVPNLLLELSGTIQQNSGVIRSCQFLQKQDFVQVRIA
jgi:MoaA/NifB/PqqE/SkfB family radical SAM enzyme